MFGISGEHLLILGIVLLIFGPKRLPELGNTLGKAIRNFKDAVSGVEEAKFRHLGEEPPKQNLANENPTPMHAGAVPGATEADPALKTASTHDIHSSTSGSSGSGDGNPTT